MKVTLKAPWRYWRDGHTPEDYPAGEVEMDAKAAACAEQCKVVVVEAADKGKKKDA